MGGIQAGIDGRNILDGGPTLKDKLALMVAKYGKEAMDNIGDGGVREVYLANRKNLDKFNGRHRVFGEKIFGEEGIENGFAQLGRAFGLSNDGYPMYQDNEIYLSKSTVRGMWKGFNKEIGTFFHEWNHCNDYFTGMAENLFKNSNSTYLDMLEYRAHNAANSLYYSPWRQGKIEMLKLKLFP